MRADQLPTIDQLNGIEDETISVIGLVGPKQSGKSTAVEYLQEKYPNLIELKLAGKLKESCSKAFNIPEEHFESQNLKEVVFTRHIELNRPQINTILKEFGLCTTLNFYKYQHHIGVQLTSPRHILQYVGTELLRSVAGPDVHIESLNLEPGNMYVISDIRFENELTYFKRHEMIEFLPLYITRDNAERTANFSNHASEVNVPLLKKRCVNITNNGTLDQFKQNLLTEVSKYDTTNN